MEVKALNNERALLLEIAGGDEHAFATLVRYYGPQLETAIYQVIRTELVVKDIVQDVFLHIWLDRERLPQLESPRVWFFRIAYYRSYSWLRNQGVRQRGRELITEQQAALPASSEVEELASFAETKRFIEEAISELSPQAKRIYLLSREEHMKINEIADLLQISPQTVKNTLTNALGRMRKYLAAKGVLLPAILLLISYK